MINNSGLILFNKPPGITSFDALRGIKRALGTGRVGHTGTLDKFASGLLIVLVGKSLRLSKWFTHCDKKYIGKIRFGEETDTLDPEGKIIAQAALPSRESVESVLSQFSGSIMQAPPSFSAIHINGKRASDLSRSGKEIEMKKREVTIYKLELLSWEPPFAEIFVHCSSGTYIRSLARDIAIAAGSRGHLVELKRTHVGGFCIEEKNHGVHGAHGEEKKERDFSLQVINKTVINSIGMPWFEVNANEKREILQGKPLDRILEIKTLNSSVYSSEPMVRCSVVKSSFDQFAAVFEGEELIAIIEKNGLNAALNWKYACVLAE
jgi:tRNA pseudouridine55 synthase